MITIIVIIIIIRQLCSVGAKGRRLRAMVNGGGLAAGAEATHAIIIIYFDVHTSVRWLSVRRFIQTFARPH